MATKVILPKLGQTMEEGTIVEWFKAEGDPVARGEALFSVESDKAVLEVEAKAAGVLRKVLVPAGQKVPIMTPVGIVGAADEDISALLAEAGPVAAAPSVAASAPAQGEQAPLPEYGAEEQAPVHAPGERIVASPRARRLAAERGIDLAYVVGSGPNGRIIERDVLAYAAAQPLATPLARRLAAEAGMPLTAVPSDGGRVTAEQVRAARSAPTPPPSFQVQAEGEGSVTPMAGVRAVIANRMATSAHTTAPVTLQSVVDATELVALRTRLKDAFAQELGFAIGYNDLLAYIVARCLTEFPYMNARLDPEGIRQLPEVNLGLAVDSERGLLVPVIHGAHRMGVKELAVRFRDPRRPGPRGEGPAGRPHRRDVHHHQPGDVWRRCLYADHQPARVRHPGRGAHPPRAGGRRRPGGRAPAYVAEPDLRPPPGGRRPRRQIPPGHHALHRVAVPTLGVSGY